MDQTKRHKRAARIRARVHGTKTRPRASVYRSLSRLNVQLINDETGQTMVAAAGQVKKGVTKVAQAEALGAMIAQQAKTAGITEIVFDRGGYKYHGRVKALAEAMRKGGLHF